MEEEREMNKPACKWLLSLMAVVLAIGTLVGCNETTARPAALAGDDQNAPAQHERHASGIESQARD
jgi:hypothetical protein